MYTQINFKIDTHCCRHVKLKNKHMYSIYNLIMRFIFNLQRKISGEIINWEGSLSPASVSGSSTSVQGGRGPPCRIGIHEVGTYL
jgi:hypothetical protein